MEREIIAYYRVSTDVQGIDGHGMAAQRKAVEGYAARVGSQIIATYAEVETGRKDRLDNRPELKSAIAHARRSRAVLVIARIDRLARSVLVTAQLLASGVEFVACDAPHANHLTIHILAAMAEHEGHLISERTKAGLAAARARGVVLGRSPTHFTPEMRASNAAKARVTRMNRTREIYADLVPQVAGMRRKGKSAKEIADILNERGQRNQYGRLWTLHAVRSLCYREDILPPVVVKDEKYFAHLHKARLMSGEARTQAVLLSDSIALPIALELLAGKVTLTGIAHILNARDLSPAQARIWSRHNVADLLRRNQKLPSREFRKEVVRTPRMIAAGEARVQEARQKRLKFLELITRFQSNGYSLEAIASTLTEYGYTTLSGKEWSRQRVKFFLKLHEAIERRIAGTIRKRKHDFTWTLTCQRCSSSFVARTSIARYCSKDCKKNSERALRKLSRARARVRKRMLAVVESQVADAISEFEEA
jgi:DNA invertase Pin-like site-specific DNA recombinase